VHFKNNELFGSSHTTFNLKFTSVMSSLKILVFAFLILPFHSSASGERILFNLQSDEFERNQSELNPVIFMPYDDMKGSLRMPFEENNSCVDDLAAAANTVLSFELPDSLCMGESFTVVNTSTGSGLTYSWSVNPATAASIDNPTSLTPTFTANGPAGTYTISVTVNSPVSGPETQNFSLYINEAPSVLLVAQDDDCETAILNPEATFALGEEFISSVVWNFVGAVPSSSNEFFPTGIQYNNPGNYTVVVTVENECGTATDSTSFALLQGPVLSLEFPDSVSVEETFTIENNSTGDQLVYDWSVVPASGVDIDDPTSPTPVFTANGPEGFYTISVIVANPVCDPVSQIFDLNVGGNPASDLSFELPDSLCMVESFTVVNTSTGSGLTYSWSVNPATAASIDNPTSPTPTFTANGPAGTYTISVTVNSPVSGPETQNFSLYINEAPGVLLGIQDDDCETAILNPEATFAPGEEFISSVVWNFVGAVPSSSNEFFPTGIQYNNPGSYTVLVTVQNECGIDVGSASFSLLQGPDASFEFPDSVSVGETFTIENNSTGDQLVYDWSVVPASGVDIDDPTSPTPVFTANGPEGFYTISVIVANPVCDPVSQTFDLNVGGNLTVTKEEKGSPYVFTLYPSYPNPFEHETTIRFSAEVGNTLDLGIYTATGQPVYSASKYYSAGFHEIPITRNLLGAPGIYIYRIVFGTQQVSGVMTLQR
jgi:hypothetical protein